MAPMVTDSYLNFNSSEFGRDKSNTTNGYYTSNKPPLPSMSFNSPGTDQSNNFNSLSVSLDSINNFKKKYTSEDTILDLLKGNNYKQQTDLFEDLIIQSQNNSEYIINFKNVKEFHSALGFLLYNTISNEVQRNCLKFLQIYFKQIDKQKKSSQSNSVILKKIDASICENLLEYLMSSSISSKLQLKQISIDLIYTLMKLTDSLSLYFDKFIKLGIENNDIQYAKTFMETTLFIVLTDEFETHDFNSIMKSLINKLTNLKLESSAMKCLNKIENVLKYDKFQTNLNKMPLNLKTIYMNTKNKSNNNNFNSININSIDTSTSITLNNNSSNANNLKFNLINDNIVKKLSGEDEIQRLQAIKDLEQTVRNITDIRSIYPYYQDFIIFMNDFVDDSNYEIRLASLKLLTIFIEKLDTNVNQCYKAICQCARQVMSQTHQSKTIKQALNTMLLLTIDNMTNPVLVLECLLYKIKDRSAKAREEFLNIIITAVIIKFSDDKYDSLRKVFFQVVPLLCDIKRNVRHAALECIAILFTKIKQNVSSKYFFTKTDLLLSV